MSKQRITVGLADVYDELPTTIGVEVFTLDQGASCYGIAIDVDGWSDGQGGEAVVIEAQSINGELRLVAHIWNGDEDPITVPIGVRT